MVSKINEFRNSNVELAKIEDVSKFNERFTNYQRDDVQGYELLSLIHNVIDYNEQYTTDSSINKESYNPIVLSIDMGDNTMRKNLTRDGTNRLFTTRNYAVTAKGRNDSNSFQRRIEDLIEESKRETGVKSDDIGNKLAKNISNIFMKVTPEKDEVKEKANTPEFMKISDDENTRIESVYSYMANMYNQCTGNTDMTKDIAKTKLVIGKEADTNKYYKYANMLYEYMQFKRAVFKCTDTDVEYDEQTGRVSKMAITMTGLR